MSAAQSEPVTMNDEELSYPLYDDEGLVYCQECGETFRKLGHHLSRGHDELSIQTYKDQYGEDIPMMARDDEDPGDLPPSEMTIPQIADEADEITQEISQLQNRLALLRDELESRRERIAELDEIFESVANGE